MNYSNKFVVIFSFFLYLFVGNVSAVEVLKVDLTDSIRPVTHCASGALYGVTEKIPADINTLVAPLKPYMYCQPPEGKSGNQHDFGDGFIVADRLKGTTAKVQISFADLLPYWPYQWPGQSKWLSEIERLLKKKQSSGLTNIHSYVIWNEPDGTWGAGVDDFCKTVWKPTYDLIRKIEPNAKIVGPAIAYYQSAWMTPFLTFCKKNNCMPDLICWHQWGSQGFVGAVKAVRKLQSDLGLKERQYCINEYSRGSDDYERPYEGCPGYCVPFIAKFERNNVESATISWWHTGLPGRLGSLLTDKNEKGGGWWLYKWYGDMTGYMAMVTPPNDESNHVDAFASVDRKRNTASIVVGGNSVGDVNVVFSKVPNFLSGKVNVKIERVTWKSKDTPVTGTNVVSEKVVTVSGGTFTIPLKIESELYAYRIFLTALEVPQTPFGGSVAVIPGIIEAENYDVAGQGFSYYDNDDDDKGGTHYRNDCVDIVKAGDGYAIGYTEKGEWLEYSVEVEKEGEYDVTANVSNGGKVDGFSLFVDGKEVTKAYSIPKISEDWSIYDEVPVGTISLTEGKHLLKLQIVGSYVNIDWLKFSDHTLTDLNDVLNFHDVENVKNVLFFDMEGHQVSPNNIESNRIYIAIISGKKVRFIKSDVR